MSLTPNNIHFEIYLRYINKTSFKEKNTSTATKNKFDLGINLLKIEVILKKNQKYRIIFHNPIFYFIFQCEWDFQDYVYNFSTITLEDNHYP